MAGWGNYDPYGQEYKDTGASTFGLDPNSLKTTYTASTWRQPDENKWQLYGAQRDQGRAQMLSGPSVTQTYQGPGGTWTGKEGLWQNALGKRVADLPGYLKKGSLQQTGADYSDYQNQLKALLADPSKIQQTAGYQFQKGQGEEAINRSAAARGSLGGGGVLAELAKYGQGLASQEYGTQVGRLADLMRGAQQFGVQSGYYQDINSPPEATQVSYGRPAQLPAPQPAPAIQGLGVQSPAEEYRMRWGV